MPNTNWLRIQNVSAIRNDVNAPRKAEVWIDGVIGSYDWFDGSGTVAAQFIRTIDALALKEGDEIAVRMNTPGGVVSDGVTITNYLINHPAAVSIRVEGQAASIGSVIAMAADPGKLTMGLGATMFIHDPWTLVAGNAEQMRKAADTLDKMRDSILAIYQRRVDLSVDDIKTLMRDETTMTAEEAVTWGFADDMDANLKAAACADMAQVLAQVRAQLNPAHAGKPAGSAPAQNREVNAMPEKILSELSREVLAAKRPDLIQAINDEAVNAERERVQAILSTPLANVYSAMAATAIAEGHSAGQFALAILTEEGKTGGATLAKIKAEAPAPVPQPAEPEEEVEDEEDEEEVAKGDTAQAFDASVTVNMTKHGMSRGKAIAAAAKNNPKAHAAWVAKQNGGKQ